MTETTKGLVTTAGPPSISPAIFAGDICFVSAQVARDETFGVLRKGDIEGQTFAAFERVENVLKTVSLGLENVISVTAYIAPGADFSLFNTAWNDIFSIPRPSRCTVNAELLVPGALIQISVVASRAGRSAVA